MNSATPTMARQRNACKKKLPIPPPWETAGAAFVWGEGTVSTKIGGTIEGNGLAEMPCAIKEAVDSLTGGATFPGKGGEDSKGCISGARWVAAPSLAVEPSIRHLIILPAGGTGWTEVHLN